VKERRPYDDPKWQTVRTRVLSRDAHRCVDCGRKADRVDHVRPWRDGGAWFDPANLQAVCASCNTKRAYATGGRQGRSDAYTCTFHDPPGASCPCSRRW